MMKLTQSICILAALGATCAQAAKVMETNVYGGLLKYSDEDYSGLDDYSKIFGIQQTWDNGNVLHPEVSFEFSPEDSIYYIHAGMRVFWHNFSLAFGPGYYHQGAGPDLGGNIQLKSNLRYDITPNWQIGFYHLSNGGLKDYNPGANGLFIGYNFSAK